MHLPIQHVIDRHLPHAVRGSAPGRLLLSGLLPIGSALVGNHRGSLVPSVASVASAVHRVPATIGRAVWVVEAVVDGGSRELGIAGALSLLALARNELLFLDELLVQVLVQLGDVDAHLLELRNVLVKLGIIELVGPPGLEDGDGGDLPQITGEVVTNLAAVDTLNQAEVDDVLAGVSSGALRVKVRECEGVTGAIVLVTFFRPVCREASGICK